MPAAGDVIIRSGEHPVAAVKTYGKGRVVAFAYVEEGFTPQSVNPVETKTYWDYWEYQYSLLSRAVLWAAGRDAGVRIDSLAADTAGRPSVKLALTSDAVRRYLAERHSIPLHRMHILGFGEVRAVADNSTREGRAQNRRVEIRLLTRGVTDNATTSTSRN